MQESITHNTTSFAKVLNELYPDYFIYEYEDFLRIMVQGLTEVLAKGDAVKFSLLGTISPKITGMYSTRLNATEQGRSGGNISVKWKNSAHLIRELRARKQESKLIGKDDTE